MFSDIVSTPQQINENYPANIYVSRAGVSLGVYETITMSLAIARFLAFPRFSQ